MSLDDLTCDTCGMRFADARLYHEHLAAAHRPPHPNHSAEEDTQPFQTGMPTGSTVREDTPDRPER